MSFNLGHKTVVVPLVAFTILAVGGVALASQGVDLNPIAAEHAKKPVEEPTDSPTDEPSKVQHDDAEGKAEPSPSLVGLCHAYQAGGYASSTKNGNVNPAFRALESAAGGAANLPTFCDTTLANAKAAHVPDTDDADDSDETEGSKPVKPTKPDHDGGSSHKSDHAKH